jgi:aspartate aminotransferase
MVQLAERVQRVKPSFTLEMTSRAAELKSQGVDVINFSAGEPDFNTPLHIREAAKKALDDGYTKYTAGAGMLELREAVCTKLKRENRLEVDPGDVLISNGEKQSLSLACQTLFQKGDKVLVFRPYWVSYPEFVELADAEPVLIDTIPERNYEPDFAVLEKGVSNQVKGVIVNSPSNPTGGVWSESALLELLRLAKLHGWIVISDECYERLVFDGEFISMERLNREHRIGAEVLTCMSLSKTYAMTGWRIGYAFGEKEIIRGMSKLQGQMTSCANAIGQKAAVAALTGDQSPVEEMRQAFKQRRDLMVQQLNEIPGVQCALPGGAFYAFPDMSFYLGKRANGKPLKDTFDLSDYLLNDARVVTVPGDGFGAPGYVRFSYATDTKTIEEGLRRTRRSLKKLT